ncbi:glutamine amidotransferase [Porphyromonas crevioricanis]|uniref:Glutamine--fructose-6-phosphate aminotransferase [isomerizing] n=2 Tax=Porphyromonas crevioricanis TaxID=393921 RepID=A0A0A2FX16_9PORP|nr:glutamine--fructose-6-phosphate transaminase (isomerizing) [Porphyromonas crevioricanis]KGN91059.1 glutamine amidotransferase [Porphyromonas crevioricanis]KGN94655.1 glutamine amidotransferase [Porphyromonas crevioricanis]SJZ57371.1 glutamine--fructose-6-phosphate transaminase [Porphyromonas crevioricanis]SQH73412.1 Glucosamine--fructose-6-phosphate aminotransferase [isomerizing] [Porphyromonas crevioricanis]GAD05922.1 Glucosamine-fructose-6-phosphate aminotransferase [Porphyromonas crevior
MCGIVGYIGRRDAYPFLISGLKRLEYRGYDSAGIALHSQNKKLNVYKTKGKVENLENCMQNEDKSGYIGIAHTRWATHGEPSDLNAHPHYSSNGQLALVHNGIIENYRDIKSDLEEKGYTFRSDTDTEVLVQLISYVKSAYKLNTFEATQLALKQVIGAYAIAVLSLDEPDRIVAARKSSPLVIGIGQDEFYLASDASPIVAYTKDVVYPEDNEVIELMLGRSIRIENLEKQAVFHEEQKITLDIGMIEKGGYPHFMLKEIFDQPRVLRDCMRGRINADASLVTLSSIIDYRERLLAAQRFIITACGTSWHAALIGKQLIESIARIPVEVEYASEFRYRDPVIMSNDVVIAISQSGETADTLAAVKLAKSYGAYVYGICNSIGSSIARESDTGTYIHVGPEIGVASTKAFTGQVCVLVMLALCLAREKGTIEPMRYKELVQQLAGVPDDIEEILASASQIEKLAPIFTYARNFLYLGRGYNYPVALEGALKLKEISYIHAEGYPAAEMKHGPIALIDEEMPVVFIASHNSLYEKVLSNIQEVKARKGRILAIVSKGDTDICQMADYVIELPSIDPALEPLLTVIPLQLLSYYIAVTKGRDVDQPRNLAKSVTVE